MPQDFHGVMNEFSKGGLHSGSKQGPKVKNRKQALAIAFSEDKKYGPAIRAEKALKGLRG